MTWNNLPPGCRDRHIDEAYGPEPIECPCCAIGEARVDVDYDGESYSAEILVCGPCHMAGCGDAGEPRCECYHCSRQADDDVADSIIEAPLRICRRCADLGDVLVDMAWTARDQYQEEVAT